MTQLSSSLAATHDGWFREPAIKHVDVALRLWWRHLQRHQPLVVEIIDWAIAGGGGAGTGCSRIDRKRLVIKTCPVVPLAEGRQNRFMV